MRALLVLPLIALAASIAMGVPCNRSDEAMLDEMVEDLEDAADALANMAESSGQRHAPTGRTR